MNNTTSVAQTDQASNGNRLSRTQNPTRAAIAPAVDIAESESGITLFADMPGVAKERLSIKVEGDNLTIEGQAQIDVPDNIALLHGEVRNPDYRREFTLSRDLDPARIEATLSNGVLQMYIPKSEAARPKRIEVKVA